MAMSFVPVLDAFDLLLADPAVYGGYRQQQAAPRRCNSVTCGAGGPRRRPASASPFRLVAFENPYAAFCSPTKAARTDDEPNTLSVDVSGFDPSEVKVSADKGVLTVSAEKEVTDEETGSVHFRSVRRSVALPKSCKAENLKAVVGKDGVLRVVFDANKAVENKKEEQKAVADNTKENKTENKENNHPNNETQSVASAPVEVEDVGEDTDSDIVHVQNEGDQGQKVEIVGLQPLEEKENQKNKEAPKKETPEADQEEQQLPQFKAKVNVKGYPAESLRVDLVGPDRVRVSGFNREVDPASGDATVHQFAKEITLNPRGKYDLSTLRTQKEGDELVVLADPKVNRVIPIKVNVL